MTSYDADPGAGAVYLYCRGDRYLDAVSTAGGLRMVNLYHVRIKILSESALDLANVEVPYLSGSEAVVEIKGLTHRLDASGKVVSQKMSKDAIFKEEVSEYTSEVKFNLPQVEVGDVLEYTYKINSKSWSYLRTWYFQQIYPVLHSETSLGVPDGFGFSPTFMGEVIELETQKSTYSSAILRAGTTETHIARNIPAFEEVPYIRAVRNHLARLNWKLVNINPRLF